ncbi:MAG: protein-export chaperone SecB [Proteobacteria bacterium]|nr:protein-export chaperone SecB [Pseudomonadota bacterium]
MSNIKILSQYIKDLSFEVPNAPQIFFNSQEKPNIELSINIDATKIGDNIFEVSLKISADAKSNEQRTFLCEIVYAAAFSISEAEGETLEQILLIYCPNLIFPFLRRIVANLTSDSGFPPLMLDLIDFAALYQRRKLAADSTPINDTRN